MVVAGFLCSPSGLGSDDCCRSLPYDSFFGESYGQQPNSKTCIGVVRQSDLDFVQRREKANSEDRVTVVQVPPLKKNCRCDRKNLYADETYARCRKQCSSRVSPARREKCVRSRPVKDKDLTKRVMDIKRGLASTVARWTDARRVSRPCRLCSGAPRIFGLSAAPSGRPIWRSGRSADRRTAVCRQAFTGRSVRAILGGRGALGASPFPSRKRPAAYVSRLFRCRRCGPE